MPKKLALIASKGTLDWLICHLYWPPPPPRSIMKYRFFTFYGLSLVKKDLSDLTVSPLGNPAMPMPMPTPNFMQMILGMESMATMMMKQKIADKGVASIDELRSTCIEGGVMGV